MSLTSKPSTREGRIIEPKENVDRRTQPEPRDDMLNQILLASVPQAEARGRSEALVGECVAEKHPLLSGRVRVRWYNAGRREQERWLPVLAGVVVRDGDRVLMMCPVNWPEPLVVGVIDGLHEQRERPAVSGASLAIKRDETVTVVTDDGKPLLEIRPAREGPRLKILDENIDLEVPGRLRMKAETIELQAQKGEVKITASDDVVVKGEIIHLN